MKARTIEAVVGKDRGVSDLPFEPGTRVQVSITGADAPFRDLDEWKEFVMRSYGSITDPTFVEPEDAPPAPLEPLG